CLGRAYVTLAGAGSILEVEVFEAQEGAPRLRVGRAYAVGGAPRRIAVTSSGRWAFVTDAEAPEVARVDLETGAVERLPLGGLGGAVAVSPDEELLVVARPQTLDMVVVADATGGGFASGANPVDAQP